jgi:aminomethyltransferase
MPANSTTALAAPTVTVRCELLIDVLALKAVLTEEQAGAYRGWAPKWSISAAGTCPCNTPASWKSIARSAPGNRVGLFDVSHMGEIEIHGPTRRAHRLRHHQRRRANFQIGQAQYSGLLYEHGGFVDDILVHKIATITTSCASTRPIRRKDYQHIAAANKFQRHVDLASDRYTQLAIQGPRALGYLAKADRYPISRPSVLSLHRWRRSGIPPASPAPATPARTASRSISRPNIPSASGTKFSTPAQEFGIKPCGLGARNTLRLEAGMALYGHEIHATITPFEAGLAWIVKLDKGDFIGRAALARQKEQGVTRKLIGFEMTGRGIGRDDYEVFWTARPGLGHERRPVAHAEQEHRNVLPSL